ncbi:jg8452 [Pararge aegeria aegeria]|uniref:Jg8452 protein n=1 Tax=Pararge aegeria aegeria TaxID=348720 RepID=A0A8S4RZT5_9NEOP|nr:jg8452 [Pararge aegeria aegeria]
MLGLIIILCSLALENIHSEELVVTRVVQSEEIILSPNTSSQNVTEILPDTLQNKNTGANYKNILYSSKESPSHAGNETVVTLSSGNLSVKISNNHRNGSINMSVNSNKHMKNSSMVTENSNLNNTDTAIDNGDRIIIKPIKFPPTTSLGNVPSGTGSNSSSTTVASSPGNTEAGISNGSANTTEVSLVDRSSFNGDLCPTGYVRIYNQCLKPE